MTLLDWKTMHVTLIERAAADWARTQQRNPVDADEARSLYEESLLHGVERVYGIRAAVAVLKCMARAS